MQISYTHNILFCLLTKSYSDVSGGTVITSGVCSPTATWVVVGGTSPFSFTMVSLTLGKKIS